MTSAARSMDLLRIIGIVSVAFTGVCEATGVLPDALDAAVGGTVMFITSVTRTPTNVAWTFTNESDVDSQIITFTPTANNTSPQYVGRVRPFKDTGSLELMNVTTSDSGPYRVTIQYSDLKTETGRTELSVHVPISGAELTISPGDLLEFNSSVTFSCSVSSGSSLSFLWQNISSEISASDKVLITDGGANLTIPNVTRYDRGPFKCTVSNPVSQVISNPVSLSISYGPDVDLQVSPPDEHFESGTTIRLNCQTSSSPPAQLQWFLNDTLLPNTGAEHVLTEATEAESGGYSCQAFNSKTMRYTTSRVAPVTLLGKLTRASLTPSPKQPIRGNNVTLTCDSLGSVYSRLWSKAGTALIPDDDMMLDDGNRTLFFKTVRQSDGGEYSCILSNPLEKVGTSYTMLVNYGPDQVAITGPTKVNVKDSVKLTCTAESTPAANFTWKQDGTVRGYSSIFEIKDAQWSDNGTYVCEAENNVTKNTTIVTHQLSVTEKTSSCSGGCIAAIVVVCLIIIIAAAVGGFCLYRRKKQNKLSGRQETVGENNPSFTDSQSQDVNYAEVSFYQKANGQTVRFGSSDNNTDYAEVKVRKNPTSPPTYDAHLKRAKK